MVKEVGNVSVVSSRSQLASDFANFMSSFSAYLGQVTGSKSACAQHVGNACGLLLSGFVSYRAWTSVSSNILLRRWMYSSMLYLFFTFAKELGKSDKGNIVMKIISSLQETKKRIEGLHNVPDEPQGVEGLELEGGIGEEGDEVEGSVNQGVQHIQGAAPALTSSTSSPAPVPMPNPSINPGHNHIPAGSTCNGHCGDEEPQPQSVDLMQLLQNYSQKYLRELLDLFQGGVSVEQVNEALKIAEGILQPCSESEQRQQAQGDLLPLVNKLIQIRNERGFDLNALGGIVSRFTDKQRLLGALVQASNSLPPSQEGRPSWQYVTFFPAVALVGGFSAIWLVGYMLGEAATNTLYFSAQSVRQVFQRPQTETPGEGGRL
jgi:hypothetical protein